QALPRACQRDEREQANHKRRARAYLTAIELAPSATDSCPAPSPRVVMIGLSARMRNGAEADAIPWVPRVLLSQPFRRLANSSIHHPSHPLLESVTAPGDIRRDCRVAALCT